MSRSFRTLALLALSLAASGAQAAGLLLVANKEADTVSLLDLADGRTLGTLPTGQGPHEIAASNDGRLAVVTNYGTRAVPGRSLTVIDLATRTVARTIDLGTHTRPHGVQFLSDHRRVAVTAEGSGNLLVVDVQAGQVLQAVATGQSVSHMVALAPDDSRAFVANIGSGSLSVIDLRSGALVKNLPTGGGAEGVAVAAGGREVWVSNRADNTLSVVDARTLEIRATLKSADFPIRAAPARGGEQVLVTNARSGELAVFDTAPRRERARLKLVGDEAGMASRFFDRAGSTPIGVVAEPSGRRVFVALAGGDRVAVVDAADWKVLDYWPTGAEPDGMAVVAAPAPAAQPARR